MERGTTRHRQAFDAFASAARAEFGDALSQLVLYGSVARGSEGDESDVDVFAVVDTPEQKRRLERLGARIGVEHGVMLVPIVKTVHEYERMRDTTYAREVHQTGESHV